MAMQTTQDRERPALDICATLKTRVPVRGPSGRLYGYLDPDTMQIAFFNRCTKQEEVVDLRLYQRASGDAT